MTKCLIKSMTKPFFAWYMFFTLAFDRQSSKPSTIKKGHILALFILSSRLFNHAGF
ncbi:hypothetical protein [Moraxella lacunata]|uniref:hypothetical protein n=1 Tax=Moraxella lacunata TaxID=477 RepID=UPI003EE0A54A